MFRRATNQIKNGDGNVQIVGDVNLEVGIPHAEHYKRVEDAVNQALASQKEIRLLLEQRHCAEKEVLSQRLKALHLELQKLQELRQNPSQYFDLAADATANLSTVLSGRFAEEFNEQVQKIETELGLGNLSAAESIIDSVFEHSNLNSKMEAELLDAQSSLAFLRLQLGEAESRAKRAFYLDPNIDRLNRYLEQLEVGDGRLRALSEFREGKLQIEAARGSEEWVRLIATEIIIEGRFGEIKRAKKLARQLKNFGEHTGGLTDESFIAVLAMQASLAALQHKHRDVVNYGRKAITQVEKSENPDRLFVLRIKGNVGSALGELGEIREAITLTTECVEGLKELGSLARYHYGIRLNNLGDFLTRDQKPEQAVPILQESVALGVEFLPEAHPSIVRRRGNLASAYYAMGMKPKAIETLKVIKIDASQLTDYDKESVVVVMMRLFNFCCEESRWSEALSAILCVQEIGASYLNDEALERELPTAISSLRERLLNSAIVSGRVG